ncbi:MAG TPA: hypothetical protein VF230_08505 [Acidimicrobiales bacterium]
MDVTAIDATLSFDCRVRMAYVESVVRFEIVDDGLEPVFDLRQHVSSAELDGASIDPSLVDHDERDVRVVRAALAPGAHELRLRYDLDVPRTVDPLAVGWTSNAPGVVFDLWMSDLHTGRYLESWIPAPLCHDRFALAVDVEITGTSQPHAVFANGEYTERGVRYPASFTSLSPMLVIAPESRVEVEEASGVTVFKLAGPEVDLGACHSSIREYLAHNGEVFGEYAFGDRFLAYVWGTTRGMEYDGATTSSVGALEHEVFHSWFGRGVKPASANDGWIDEAFCVWYTASAPRMRQWAERFDPSEAPVVLRPPGPFDRFTPREAYTTGPRFFAGVADVLGGPDALVAAMRQVYADYRGGFLSTDDLQWSLSEAAGQDLGWAFARWVHGVAE